MLEAILSFNSDATFSRKFSFGPVLHLILSPFLEQAVLPLCVCVCSSPTQGRVRVGCGGAGCPTGPHREASAALYAHYTNEEMSWRSKGTY